MKIHSARILAGFPEKNGSLYRRLGVALGDPAAWIELDSRRIGLVRDLEMDRVRQVGHVDDVTCPAEHSPPAGLSADRETATAEAAVQILRSARCERVTADRSLPFIFAWHLQQAEIVVEYDEGLGVTDRRAKTRSEIDALSKAQSITEEVMKWICQIIARSDVGDSGVLVHEFEPLTSERVRSMVAIEFLNRGCSMTHGAIIASAPQVADCHHSGAGPLRTGTPIIVDLFPRDESTRYWGDCTRTVVNGNISDEVKAMHAAVVEAKAAATAKLVVGETANAVHLASEQVLTRHGYPISRGTLTDGPSIQHGTGHGIGLDLHEPILLDHGGGEVMEGEVFTIEPGLYGRLCGGVRIEDMLVVTGGEAKNLNALPDGLTWD
ncbi:Xaa-Pro aminopeptidase 1 [Rubripirellula tenax]|uniref:Xaa-Pro aminopeptidase 1 n=1 Tax=Rubripirellula tenax TaxID=2528015 RepID=A0A5C6E976_9BACT|nr:M24 family metallopeptidase [Rubripirellula tenax]TWU46213.1 Xaa-Pro aminopeptidase 1 [Rubripirellula tenax]